MLGMFLYYVLMIDLAVYNDKMSAQVLGCGCMVQEVLLYLVAILSMIIIAGRKVHGGRTVRCCRELLSVAVRKVHAGRSVKWYRD